MAFSDCRAPKPFPSDVELGEDWGDVNGDVALPCRARRAASWRRARDGAMLRGGGKGRGAAGGPEDVEGLLGFSSGGEKMVRAESVDG